MADDRTSGIEGRIRYGEGEDPDYIEGHGGGAWYTHLQGAERIVEFRLRAVGRAFDQYQEALSSGLDEPHIAGVALVVLQRTTFAVEDLGGLAYAALGADPWGRLSGYYARDLDSLFASIFERRQPVADLLPLPTDEEFDASPKLDIAGRAVARKLRDITIERIEPLFDFAASFWMAHREAVKTTMHGFGIVAAEHLLTPPGGGQLSEFVPAETQRPFAVALISRDDATNQHAETRYEILDLTSSYVELVKRTAIVAGELYLLLARAHRGALRLGHPWTLPNAYAGDLSDDERAILERAAADE